MLIAAAGILFPTAWLAKFTGEMLALGIVRIVFGAVGAVFIALLGRIGCFCIKKSAIKSADIIIVSLIVAVNNFPIIPLANGSATVSASTGKVFEFLFFCLSVGFFEEVYFRGLIFPLVSEFFRGKKFAELKSVIVSGAVFGLIHLVNFFGGADAGSVFMQVGYSALNGLMYAALFLFTESLLFPILCHTVFDVGGLMIERLGHGEIWSAASIALTAVVAVAAAAWIIFRFVRRYCRNTDSTDEATNGETETQEKEPE